LLRDTSRPRKPESARAGVSYVGLTLNKLEYMICLDSELPHH